MERLEPADREERRKENAEKRNDYRKHLEQIFAARKLCFIFSK